MTAEQFKPDEVLQYPLPHDGVGDMHIFTGNPEHLVLLCAGFPDNHEAMIPLAQRLKQTAAVICLPGYDDRNMYPDGYTIDDWVACFHSAKHVLQKRFPNASNKQQFSVLVHDWGVVAGTCFVNRYAEEEPTNKLILLDVLAPPHKRAPEPTPSPEHPPASALQVFHTVLGTMSYQLSFALVFALQRYVHKYVATAWMVVSSQVLTACRLTPTRKIDALHVNKHIKLTFNTMYMTYPYFFVYKSMLTGNARVFSQFFIPTKVPVLYMYGQDKNFCFHDDKALNFVSQNNGGKVVGVKDAGHWLHWQQPDLVFEEIDSFLAK